MRKSKTWWARLSVNRIAYDESPTMIYHTIWIAKRDIATLYAQRDELVEALESILPHLVNEQYGIAKAALDAVKD